MLESGELGVCSYCDWKKRHKYKFPVIKGWNEIELNKLVQNILIGDINIINDFLDDFNNKTIKDVCIAFSALKIKNKSLYVRNKCSYCGKEILDFPSVYLKNEHFYCSNDCYWKHKKKISSKGKENVFYKRIATNCDNCGKEIQVIPANYKKTNRYGESHNFCSNTCYYAYRSKYYIGTKSTMKNKKFTNEEKEQMRIRFIKNSRRADRLNSKIQLKVNRILEEINEKYEREHVIKYYAIDNYLPEHNLYIEVMGDYWHANPKKYHAKGYPINNIQKRDISKDRAKHTYILKKTNREILYLWETDILKQPDKCKSLIQAYIRNNGKLSNYHSFNYSYKNSILTLNSEIIIPYQEQNKNHTNP